MNAKGSCFLISLLVVATLLAIPQVLPMAHSGGEKSALDDSDSVTRNSILSSSAVERTVRVAIYSEPNTTLPSYATGGFYSNNYQNVVDLLTSLGHDVTVLTTSDIQNNRLTTVDFDVFVIVDNLPRESITNLVRDYWLGGGGILSFNSAFGFLHYVGMLREEWRGEFGLFGGSVPTPAHPSWTYGFSSTYNQRVEQRHPVSRTYEIGDILNHTMNDTLPQAYFDNVNLPSLVGDDFYTLCRDLDSSMYGAVAAIDNTNRGGKIVQVPGNCTVIPAWLEPIIDDAVDWLCPRPKGRILFDLSHEEVVGIDEYDEYTNTYVDAAYYDWRNAMINRSYTVDKLHALSEWNLTTGVLQKYDMLVISIPGLSFTPDEIITITEWVENGGGLLVLGDHPSIPQHIININNLLTAYEITLNTLGTAIDEYGTTTLFNVHPTTEGCTGIFWWETCYVNITGQAQAIWNTTEGNNILVAAQEYGAGRVLVSSDTTWLMLEPFGQAQPNVNDLQFCENVVNWLTSTSANILVYTSEPWVQRYQTPVVEALNDLDLRFYLTFNITYFNTSLHSQSWDLVVVDNPQAIFQVTVLDELANYVEGGGGGGRLAMSYWYMDQVIAQTHRLWPLLGFTYASNAPALAPLCVWNTENLLFNIPNRYNAEVFIPIVDYGLEGDMLHVLPNGTAVAGYASTETTDQAAIVIRNDNRTIYNGYLIDEFRGDSDESTFMDAFELWENEIAFLMQGQIDSPPDIQYEAGTGGHSVTWHPQGWFQAWYSVKIDNVQVQNARWMGGVITQSVNGLPPSIHSVVLSMTDFVGFTKSDQVLVTVVDTTNPTIDSPDNEEYVEGTTGHTITWNGTDLYPDAYCLFVDGTADITADWTSGEVVVNIDCYDAGIYNLTMVFNDTSGNFAADMVVLTVLSEPLSINAPTDFEYTVGTTGHTITWSIVEGNLTHIQIFRNGTRIIDQDWLVPSFILNVDFLIVGSYNFTTLVQNARGYVAIDTVWITVLALASTTTTTTTVIGQLDSTLIIVLGGIGAAVIVILIIVMLKKK